MDRFGRVLRRAEQRLEAPEPERSRILREMAGDLEDLYRAYRERGLDEEEARRRAERWLAPSPDALASLGHVHRPAFDRLLDRLGGTARGRLELGLATVISLALVGGALLGVLRSGTLAASVPGLWIVAALAAVGLGIGMRRGYELFVRGDRLGPGWRDRPGPLAAAAVGTGLAGVMAGAMRLTLASASPEAAGLPPDFWSEVATAASVAALGLGGGLLLALFWLLLRARAVAVTRARAELRAVLDAGGPGAGEDDSPGGRPRRAIGSEGAPGRQGGRGG